VSLRHACAHGRKVRRLRRGDRRSHLTLADIALAPFVRQFCFVDPDWFWQSPYPRLREWLQAFLESKIFLQVMSKL